MQANTIDADREQDAPRRPAAALEVPPGLAALLARAQATGDNLAAMQAARLWVGYCSRRFPGRETAPVALAALQEVIEPRLCPLCHGTGEMRGDGRPGRCLRCHGSGRVFGAHEHDGPLMSELLRLLSYLERTAADDRAASCASSRPSSRETPWRMRREAAARPSAPEPRWQRPQLQACVDALG